MQLQEPAGANSDRNALTGLFETHRARLLAMLQRRLDPALAVRLGPEDILHKGFLRANDHWPDFLRSGRSAYAWLYGLVRDILYEEYRFHTRQCRDLGKEVPWPADSVQQLELVLQARRSSPSSPSSAAVRRERQERVRQTLASLKGKDQEILSMRYFDQLSHEEIAQVLAIPANTARQRCARALQRFEEAWKVLYGPEEW